MLIDQELAAEFAELGVSIDPDEISEEDDAFEVWDVNWRSLMAFLNCETQWRGIAVGMAGVISWTGIDYASARPVFERRNGRLNKAVFADIQVMEQAALPILNEQRGDV